ncbi:MAG: mechanosensitive ion channel [Clostridia bacterium]|nr:mechanosensitive ion channel [Clostridia bacterium]
MFNLLSIADIEIETQTGTNPILDESGQFVSAEEAVSNFAKLWEEWDIVNKFIGSIPKLIIAAVLIILGIWLSRIVSKIVIKTLKSRGVDASVYLFIKSIISVVIKIAFVLFALSLFININSFLAAIGAAGITAGIGLQDSVSQFASGIQILLNHPFKAGDYIEVNGIGGNVERIQFMNTVIITPDNKRITIPNSHITTNNITNYSAEKTRRVDLSFSVSYNSDFSLVRKAILQATESCEAVLKTPEPQIFVNSHDASGISIIARVWCENADYWNAYFQMMEKVKISFDNNNINIPFDQLDVHIIDKE